MELNEYQKQALRTCMPTCRNFEYNALNLTAEVGEAFGKIAKEIRKGHVVVTSNEIKPIFSQLFTLDDYSNLMTEVEKELGDCLWQLSTLCKILGFELEDVAEQNLEKLSSRQRRNVIDGNGDNR